MILSRRERKKLQNQQQILDAALGLFAHQGVDATTMDQIADAADVSRGTVFNYFPTKENLLNAIAGEELRDLEAGVDTGGSATAHIHALMRALLTDSLAFFQVTRYILLDAMLHAAESTSPSAHLDDILRRLVRRAQTQQEIRADLDPATVAAALVGVYLGAFFRLSAAEGTVGEETVEGVRATIDLLFDGIAGPAYPRKDSSGKLPEREEER